MNMPLILFALVATHDDGTDFLWTTPSVLRQPHEHARAWDVDGTVVDNVSRGWAPLTEARVEALPPLVRRAVERAMDKCFDETIKEAA